MSSVLHALYRQVKQGAVFKHKAAAYQVERRAHGSSCTEKFKIRRGHHKVKVNVKVGLLSG